MSKAIQSEGRPAGQGSGTMKTLNKTGGERERSIVCQGHTFTSSLPTIQLSEATLCLPSPLRATVHPARPNKGQVPASLLRSSFASRRQAASQGLFKGPANPIRLLICEALSPRTPASVGTTSQGIMGLLAVIGGDRESGRSTHHKASARLGVSRE